MTEGYKAVYIWYKIARSNGAAAAALQSISAPKTRSNARLLVLRKILWYPVEPQRERIRSKGK